MLFTTGTFIDRLVASAMSSSRLSGAGSRVLPKAFRDLVFSRASSGKQIPKAPAQVAAQLLPGHSVLAEPQLSSGSGIGEFCSGQKPQSELSVVHPSSARTSLAGHLVRKTQAPLKGRLVNKSKNVNDKAAIEEARLLAQQQSDAAFNNAPRHGPLVPGFSHGRYCNCNICYELDTGLYRAKELTQPPAGANVNGSSAVKFPLKNTANVGFRGHFSLDDMESPQFVRFIDALDRQRGSPPNPKTAPVPIMDPEDIDAHVKLNAEFLKIDYPVNKKNALRAGHALKMVWG